MSLKSFALRGTVAAAALVALAAAQAATPALTGYGSRNVAAAAGPTAITTINVAGIQSLGEYGEAGNVVLTFNIGAGATVTGIGWDVNITANSPSWLSEMSVSFEGSDQLDGVFLNVGVEDDSAGTASYSSGGILSLDDAGLSFQVGADGILRVEFFEGYVDAVTPNGVWNSGTLTVESIAAVPEPGTYAMMALGLLAVGASIRRRRG